MNRLRVLQNYGRVLLLMDGRLVAELPANVAQKAGRALVSVGKQAEEWEEAERIALDQAILMRSGAPFGLTSQPKILSEAKKEAVHNRNLRRYMPGGVKSQEVFGLPSIIQHAARSKP